MIYEVIIDVGETPNKCTIAPLIHRNDFRVFRVGVDALLGPFLSPFLLHPEGDCLSQVIKTNDLSKVTGIASIDCVWRRLSLLMKKIEAPLPKLIKIPEGFKTAYPRFSKKSHRDPAGGLATIEAIFTASALLGHWNVSLLSQYYFGQEFIKINAAHFIELGQSQAKDESLWPHREIRKRNSEQRKHDRGRMKGFVL